MTATPDRVPWPRNPRYLVGRDGSVVGPSGKLLKTYLNQHGYPTIGPSFAGTPRTVPVHIVVAETFHGARPPGHQVAHYNGDRTDCRASNLRWATPSENHADKRRHGTNPQGERQHGSRLTDLAVLAIRAAYAAGHSQADLAEQYGVGQVTISNAVLGSTWSHLPVGDVPPSNTRKGHYGPSNSRARFQEADVRAIRVAAAGGASIAAIARNYRCTESAIRHVVKRRSWRHIP